MFKSTHRASGDWRGCTLASPSDPASQSCDPSGTHLAVMTRRALSRSWSTASVTAGGADLCSISFSASHNCFLQELWDFARPQFDMPSSTHGSKHEFPFEKSLCTQYKRLFRQRVCSIPFSTHELSWREPLKHAQKRPCCGTHCTHESCSTCCNRPLRCSLVIQCRLEEVHRFYYLCPSSFVLITPIQKGASRSGGGALASNATVFHAKCKSSALSEPTHEGQVVHSSE